MPHVESSGVMPAVTAPGEVPSWAGTEVRDPDGAVVGHVAALRFDRLTCRPSELVVSLPDGGSAVLPAGGLRVRLDHVVVPVAAPVPLAA